MKKSFLLILMISLNALAQSNEVKLSPAPSLPSGNRFELHGGYDYINEVQARNGTANSPLGITVGLNYNRSLVHGFGVSGGVDFVNRSINALTNCCGGFTPQANYLDFIYAGSYTADSELSWLSTVTTFLGGFSAVPMGDMYDDDFRLKTQTSTGAYFGVSARVPTGTPIDFGFNTWVKWGLSRAFAAETGLSTILSAGLGLSAIY